MYYINFSDGTLLKTDSKSIYNRALLVKEVSTHGYIEDYPILEEIC